MNDRLVLDIILYIVTISGSIWLASGMMELKYSKKVHALVLTPIVVISLLATIFVSLYFKPSNPNYYSIILGINLLLAMIALAVLAKDGIMPTLFTVATIVDVLVVICYCSNTMAYLYDKNRALEILFRIFGFIILTIFYLAFLKDKYRLFVKEYKEKKGWICLLMIPIGFFTIMYITCLYPMIIYEKSSYVHDIMLLTILAEIGVYVGIFEAIGAILEKYKLKDEKYKMQAKLYLWKAQLESQEEVVNNTKRIRHDLRHHDKLLLKFLEEGHTEKAVDYLKQHIEYNFLDKSIQYCDNYTINSLLTIYSNKAEKEGIITKCEAKVAKETKFDEIRITNILANLFENAIEACMNLKEGAQKFIDVEVDATNGLKILVRNSCNPGVEFDEDNFPISTKNMHSGIGTKSVASMVEENNGFIDYFEKNGVFEARAIINC